MRHYVPADGRAAALADRFRDHVFPLIERHGLVVHDYWEAADGSGELWYVMAWDDEAAMGAGWDRFRDDPGWAEAKRVTETDGPLVKASRSIILRRPDYYRP